MTKPFLLSASILSADFRHLEEDIRACVDAGVDWIHIDVMDGHFVPNITMGPFIVEWVRKITAVPLDVHLMIEKPERHIRAFADAGADYISIHSEGNPNVMRTLQEIRDMGCKSGLAVNPGTPEVVVRPLIDLLDLILVLTVNPGFSAQKFMPQVLYKIREIRKLIDTFNPGVHLEVDGGINASTIHEVIDAGVSVAVSANAIFNYPEGLRQGIASLRKAGQ
jgi:ribulose-phosphate 3-epimerase